MPCNFPHRLRRGVENDFMHLDVPCGRCMGCRIMNAQAWAIRCANEAQLHYHNSYITLTYDNEHLPKNASLDHRDWQLFAKKLRNRRADRFSYFMCGEYGDEGRPHFHACLFGIDFHDKVPWKKEGEHQLYLSAELAEIWGNGFVTVGTVTFQSAGYIARYITKKLDKDKALHAVRLIDPRTGEIIYRTPEYIRMSRNPAIGKNWITRFKDEVLTHDSIYLNNRRYKVPRYYDLKIKEWEPERAVAIHNKRKEHALTADPNESTKQRRQAKEAVLVARQKQRGRA